MELNRRIRANPNTTKILLCIVTDVAGEYAPQAIAAVQTRIDYYAGTGVLTERAADRLRLAVSEAQRELEA